MPEARTQYLRSMLQRKKAAEPEQPMTTAALLKKRRAERAKREAEIQRTRIKGTGR